MRLALALGKLPGEIDQMPYADFLEFMAFYEIEPWGLAVQDAMQANAVQVLANVNRDAKQRPEPYRIKDFLLFAPPEAPKAEPTVDGKTAAQWRLIFQAEALAASHKRKE
jgi:hypothetical protein